MQFKNLFLSAALALPVTLGAQTVDRAGETSADQLAASDERIAFHTLDENDDGFINRDEAKGTYLDKRFDALDADHDGRLSPSEVDAGSPAAAGAGATTAPE